MRYLTILALSISLFSFASVTSADSRTEAHAMFYYQIPLGADKPVQREHSFGFRMDRAMFDAGEMIQYQQLVKQPAVLDLRMGYHGLQGFTIAGNDYAAQYRVNRADEEGDESGSLPSLPEFLDDVPLGVYMGVIIGVIILTGASQ